MTWYNISWNYRKAITVSNSGSSLTDYQTLIIMDTAGLVTVGKMKSDCGDIRFTDTDGSTTINYWIESGCNTASTKIWVKIPSIVSGNNTIYLYYDNSGASSTSNGPNTFVLFDNFDGTSLDANIWNNVGGTLSVSDGYCTLTTAGGIPWQDGCQSKVDMPNDIKVWWSMRTNIGYNPVFFIRGQGVNWDTGYAPYFADDGKVWLDKKPTSTTYSAIITNAGSWSNGNWYNFKCEIVGTSIKIYQTDMVTPIYNITDTSFSSGKIGFSSWGTNGIASLWDSIRVAKHVATEPTTCIGGEEVSTVSWLTGWNRRKLTTITGSTSGAQTDYQMKLIAHKTTGTDTSTDIYLGANVKDDFSDLRFTKNDGSTFLNYWIESYISGSVATVWIKIPSVPIGPCTTTIYTYYDYSSATSVSNGTNTFILYIDGTDYNNWTKSNPGNVIENVGGELHLAHIAGSGYQNTRIISTTTDDVVLEFKFKVAAVGTGHQDGIIFSQTSSMADRPVEIYAPNGNSTNILFTYAGSYYTIYSSQVGNTYYKFKINVRQSVSKNDWYLYSNSDSLLGSYINATESRGSPTAIGHLFVGSGSTPFPSDQTYSYIFFRKYAGTEPTFSSTGTEQTAPNITATSMTITPSENPCRVGICTVLVSVTWTNNGGTEGIFTPSIKVDGTPVVVIPTLTPVSVNPSGTITQLFTISGLSVNTHGICPDPN